MRVENIVSWRDNQLDFHYGNYTFSNVVMICIMKHIMLLEEMLGYESIENYF